MSLLNIATARPRRYGMALVITSALLWGISGIAAQYLFQQQGFSPGWLVVIRLLVSGVILLGIAFRKNRSDFWKIWRSKQDRLNLILFGILGVLGVQYTYFMAIDYGNAATATVLQYLAPVIIACYIALQMRRLPNMKEVIAIAMALLGTFLLVTHGNLNSLSISRPALFWGIVSAVAMAFYTLNPRRLLAAYGSLIVTGWAMLVGGIGFSFIHPPWKFQGEWSITALIAVVFIVLFATVVAFYCFLESLNYLSAPEASLLSCIEPVASAVLAVIWLQVPFGYTDWAGTFCIVTTVGMLAVMKKA